MSGHGETLPDLLRPGLGVVSIGLNPSPPSVAAGFYFANPRNRFWRALRASRLCPFELEPSPAALRRLFEEGDMGFTDVVKRVTPGSAGLRAADFRRDAPLLAAKLARHRPAIAWFHGREAWRGFRRHAAAAIDGDPAADAPRFGVQPASVAGARVFVSPNPSPANAAFSLHDLVASYDELAALRDALRPARPD